MAKSLRKRLEEEGKWQQIESTSKVNFSNKNSTSTTNNKINTKPTMSTWDRVLNKANTVLNDTGVFLKGLGLGAKSGGISAVGQTEFLSQQRSNNYRRFQQQATEIQQKQTTQGKLDFENKKFEDAKVVNGVLVRKQPKINDSAIMQSINKKQEEVNQEIAKNTEEAKTKTGKYLAGNVAPSMGQSLVGTGLDILAPGMGSAYRMLSYGGNYTQDALKSGMNEKQSAMYGLTMAGVETAMDSIMDKVKGTLIGETKNASGLKDWLKVTAKELGINSTFEGLGESLTEPLQEKVKELYGGKADYENILQRMTQSFWAGFASELLMEGASAGYGGSLNLINKIQNGENVSTEEITKALKEINEKEEIDIEKLLVDKLGYNAQDLYINKDVQQRTNEKMENVAEDISRGEYKGIKNNQLIENSELDKEEKKILTEIAQKYNLSEQKIQKAIEKTKNGFFNQNQPTTIENKPISEQSQQVVSNEEKVAENRISQGIDNNLKKYTDKEIKFFTSSENNIIEGVNGNFKSFVSEHYDTENKTAKKHLPRGKEKTFYLGRLSDSIADNLSNLINNSNRFSEKYDLKDTNFIVKENNIEHAFNQHGNEIKEGQLDVTPENYSKIGEVVGNPDYIGLSDNDIKGKPTLYMAKKINGYSVAIEVVKNNKQMYPQTYFVFKSDSKEWNDFIKNHKLKEADFVESTGTSSQDKNAQGDTIEASTNIIPQNDNNMQQKNVKNGLVQNDNNIQQKNVREDGLLDARTETTTKVVKKKTLNPTEISNLTIEDASSTPKLTGKKKARGNKQSNFLKNITVKSRFLNQDFRNELTEEDNIRYYNGISNIDTLNKAYDDLQAEGQKATLEWFNKDSSQATAEDTAKGWILLKQYQDAGDYQSAVEVAKKMREIGTSAGQTIQAFNILSRLTPNGMFYYAQKELSEIYSEMSKGKTKEWIDKHKTDFDLTPIETQFIKDTMEEVSTMDDGYEKKVKLAEIQKLITDKIPPTAGKSIKAWMRISMLFNPKTQVRNVLGNAITVPVNFFSDMFSTAVDKAIAKKTGKRTTGMLNLKEYGKGFKKGLYESYNDFKRGINTKNIEGNRFEVTDGKSFKDEGIGKALNFTDNVLNFVMDAGDRSFYEATFTNSINNQLVLNNTTEVTQEMIDIASNEALGRTWQDDNAYTQAVLTIRNALNGKIGKNKGLAYGLGDVIIPFAKTPANLTKAIVDYSPVGLVKTLAIDAKKFANSLENGQYDVKQQHKFVQNLGKGMAGSLLYVLGYALANAGIISGEADEDKDVKNFMKNSLGIGSYSIRIGDKSFAYDWAQPVATPFAIMSNFVKTSKENPDANILEKAISAVNIGTEQLLEQSFMESINTVLNGNGTTLENLTQAVMELPSRAIPTFSKQIADLVDSTQRTTFEYGKPVKSAINAVVAKLPVASKTLPAQVDTFGNEIQKYGGDNSIFNVFFNPANMNKGTLTKAGQEIYNLYQETGNTAIFPRTAPYYINNKNEKVTMDAKQRADFQKVTGQYVQKNLNSLLDNKEYLSLNADERAKFLEEVVADSYSKAKYEILGIESEDGAKKREKIENVGEKTYYDFNIRLDKLQREKERNNETVKDSEKIEILHDATYNKDTKSKVYEYMLGGNKDDVYNSLKQLTNNKVTINDYLGYKTTDLSADKKDDGTKNGKSISGSAKKKLLDFLNNSNLSYIERLYIYGTKYPNLTSAQKTSLINKIKSLNLTSEEQKQIYLKLKDVEELSDGRIRWK